QRTATYSAVPCLPERRRRQQGLLACLELAYAAPRCGARSKRTEDTGLSKISIRRVEGYFLLWKRRNIDFPYFDWNYIVACRPVAHNGWARLRQITRGGWPRTICC